MRQRWRGVGREFEQKAVEHVSRSTLTHTNRDQLMRKVGERKGEDTPKLKGLVVWDEESWANHYNHTHTHTHTHTQKRAKTCQNHTTAAQTTNNEKKGSLQFGGAMQRVAELCDRNGEHLFDL